MARGRNQGEGNRQGKTSGRGKIPGEITAREDVSDREDHREMETVREEDRRAMARVSGRNRSEGRDGRFGGSQGRQGQRQNTRKNDDMAFAPELTKTSKDSKRERDRENKKQEKKILIRHRVADADQIRVDSIRIPESRKLCRNRLRSQNRKRRNLRLRKSHFRRR